MFVLDLYIPADSVVLLPWRMGYTRVAWFFRKRDSRFVPDVHDIIPMESVPEELGATAGALSMGVGEVIGATITPAVARALADHFGLPIVMLIAAAGPLIATFGPRRNSIQSAYALCKNAIDVT